MHDVCRVGTLLVSVRTGKLGDVHTGLHAGGAQMIHAMMRILVRRSENPHQGGHLENVHRSSNVVGNEDLD